MNKAILIGRLTKDPELTFAAGTGTAICKFTMAVNRQFKKGEADFINCTAFGKTAETIAQYFTKGRPIAVVGNIRTGSYDAKDGTKRYTTDINVESFDFVGDSNNNGNGNNNGNVNNNENNNNYNNNNFKNDFTPVDEGDMPF